MKLYCSDPWRRVCGDRIDVEVARCLLHAEAHQWRSNLRYTEMSLNLDGASPTSISMSSGQSDQNEKKTLLHLVHSGMSLRQLSRNERAVSGQRPLFVHWLLLAALQHGRVSLGDEIGMLRYLEESPSHILMHLGTRLLMNHSILVEKGVAGCAAQRIGG